MIKDANNDLIAYRAFLESIPLEDFRKELKDIKFVEQDLHPLLFPLASIFEYYWEKREYLPFELWYKNFIAQIEQNEKKKAKLSDLKELVRAHRKFYDDTVNNNLNGKFQMGFKARMYRTWVSVLTQLDFCYMFEYLCAKNKLALTIECNADLDASGIDAKVNEIGFQIAKISQRKEALKIGRKTKVIEVPYVVWDLNKIKEKIKNPRTKKRDVYQNMLDTFNKYYIQLKNGFVVFKESYINEIINNINDIDKLKSIIKRISLELAGKE
ncbi:MAG: TaqI family restriction endonuclease [candidate division WOR-3 bacterium]|nr:TaqI family restriction endonuclease [candidate division WOR-3 bacterium]